MASLNRVVLIGNLTRDPELRVTPSGKSVGTIGLAINRRRPASSGQEVNNTDYFNVVVWGRLAEICQEHLKKGSPIAVDGRLQSRSWETPEGQRRSTIEVVAENVQFLWRRGSQPTAGAREDKGLEEEFEPSSKEFAQSGGEKEDFPDEVPF